MRGRVPINYHMLSDFRVAHQEALDDLLTQIIGALMTAGAVSLNRVAQDGMRVRASAGSASFRGSEKLKRCLEEAREQVERLAKERERPDPSVSRRERGARERAAREREERVREALSYLPREQAKKERQQHTKSKSQRSRITKARVSTTDPETKVMKMPDGGFRPAYNVELATDSANGIIVGRLGPVIRFIELASVPFACASLSSRNSSSSVGRTDPRLTTATVTGRRQRDEPQQEKTAPRMNNDRTGLSDSVVRPGDPGDQVRESPVRLRFALRNSSSNNLARCSASLLAAELAASSSAAAWTADLISMPADARDSSRLPNPAIESSSLFSTLRALESTHIRVITSTTSSSVDTRWTRHPAAAALPASSSSNSPARSAITARTCSARRLLTFVGGITSNPGGAAVGPSPADRPSDARTEDRKSLRSVIETYPSFDD